MTTRLRPTFEAPGAAAWLGPGGPWDVPTLDRMLGEAPPRDDLVIDGDRMLGSLEVADRVSRVAGSLAERGVGPGDPVAWQLPNGHESLVLYRACWRLGAVAIPIHHRMGAAEVAEVLERLPAPVVLGAPSLPAAEMPGALSVRSGGGWSDLLEGDPVDDDRAEPSDLAVVLFTAGTTGRPKGVLHQHRSLAYKARLMVTVHGLSDADTVLMPAPLAHVSGLLNGVLVPGVTPMRTVLMDQWQPDRALDLIEQHAVTFMVGPPTFFVGLWAAPNFGPDRVGSLRLISTGGAGVTEDFCRAASDRLRCLVKRSYGSTEVPTIAATPSSDHDTEAAHRTDGRAVGEGELRVVDPDTGASRETGDEGELWVRGPEMFAGYLDASDNREAIHEGWFRTGDLATIDDDRRLRIVGRLKDLIIRGGENIAAGEVERVLEAHPAVEQAVALGEPDDRLGERVAAFVVCSAPFDLDVCRDWFRDQGLATFKTPERVVVLDALPRLPAGKPDRQALRDRLSIADL